jgi:hypothetical protein
MPVSVQWYNVLVRNIKELKKQKCVPSINAIAKKT